MSSPFDPQVWTSAQQALDKLMDLPEGRRQAALDALDLPAPVGLALNRMLESMAVPGLLDLEPGLLPPDPNDFSSS